MNKDDSIFIFANAYAAKTAMYMLDYVLNINFTNILLLRENHSLVEFDYRTVKKHIVIYDNIDECLEKAKYVLVIKDNDIPNSSIDKIINESIIKKKKYIVVDNPWEDIDLANKDLCVLCKNKFSEISISNVPNILLIGCGMASQLYCMEVLINNILTSEKLLFSQIFSDETQTFINYLSDYGINQAFISPTTISKDESIITVQSINIGDNLNSIKNYFEIINRIQPDFIILQVPAGLKDLDLIINFFKYGLLMPIDLIVKSHFVPYRNIKVLYRDANQNNVFKYYDDIRIKTILKQSIFSKMALPTGVQKY